MASAIHYKFKSSPITKMITFQGEKVDLFTLKRLILKNENMDLNDDLSVINSITLKSIRNPGDFINKNTSLMVKRVPIKRNRRPIQDPQIFMMNKHIQPQNNHLQTIKQNPKPIRKSPNFDTKNIPALHSSLLPMKESEVIRKRNSRSESRRLSTDSNVDGNDMETVQQKTQELIAKTLTEDDKIKAIMLPSDFYFQADYSTFNAIGGTLPVIQNRRIFTNRDNHETPNKVHQGRPDSRKHSISENDKNEEEETTVNAAILGKGGGTGDVNANVVSYNGNKNGDDGYRDVKKYGGNKHLNRPSGIPESFLMNVGEGHKGSMRGQNGTYVMEINSFNAYQNPKKEQRPFFNDVKQKVEKKVVIPDAIKCPLSKTVMSQAVQIPCCNSNANDDAIRSRLFIDGKCPFCFKHQTPDSLLPNYLIRKEVAFFNNSQTKTFKPIEENIFNTNIKSKPSVGLFNFSKNKNVKTEVKKEKSETELYDKFIEKHSSGTDDEYDKPGIQTVDDILFGRMHSDNIQKGISLKDKIECQRTQSPINSSLPNPNITLPPPMPITDTYQPLPPPPDPLFNGTSLSTLPGLQNMNLGRSNNSSQNSSGHYTDPLINSANNQTSQSSNNQPTLFTPGPNQPFVLPTLTPGPLGFQTIFGGLFPQIAPIMNPIYDLSKHPPPPIKPNLNQSLNSKSKNGKFKQKSEKSEEEDGEINSSHSSKSTNDYHSPKKSDKKSNSDNAKRKALHKLEKKRYKIAKANSKTRTKHKKHENSESESPIRDYDSEIRGRNRDRERREDGRRTPTPESKYEFIKRYGEKLWHVHYRYQEHRYLKYREAPKTPFDKYIYGNHPEVVKERDTYGHDSREVEIDRRRVENRYYVQERRSEYYDGGRPLPRHKSQDDRKRGRSRGKDDLYEKRYYDQDIRRSKSYHRNRRDDYSDYDNEERSIDTRRTKHSELRYLDERSTRDYNLDIDRHKIDRLSREEERVGRRIYPKVNRRYSESKNSSEDQDDSILKVTVGNDRMQVENLEVLERQDLKEHRQRKIKSQPEERRKGPIKSLSYKNKKTPPKENDLTSQSNSKVTFNEQITKSYNFSDDNSPLQKIENLPQSEDDSDLIKRKSEDVDVVISATVEDGELVPNRTVTAHSLDGNSNTNAEGTSVVLMNDSESDTESVKMMEKEINEGDGGKNLKKKSKKLRKAEKKAKKKDKKKKDKKKLDTMSNVSDTSAKRKRKKQNSIDRESGSISSVKNKKKRRKSLVD